MHITYNYIHMSLYIQSSSLLTFFPMENIFIPHKPYLDNCFHPYSSSYSSLSSQWESNPILILIRKKWEKQNRKDNNKIRQKLINCFTAKQSLKKRPEKRPSKQMETQSSTCSYTQQSHQNTNQEVITHI